MRETFSECIDKNHLLETGVPDTDMAQELVALAAHKQQFWESVKAKAKEFPSLFLEGHYEIIKELATAVLLIDGWKALNHECLFAYLKQKKQDLELDFDYLLQLKDIRNSIDYRGVKVSYSIWQQNELKIDLTIKRLQEYIAEKLR
jgi:hypothetical protein